MPTIRVLPEAVRSRIAAGEVIERPASVVKELVENSLDAGASGVNVEFSAGGLPFLMVADDGCGMSPEDLAVCVDRHATSKLDDAEDIYRITTLGFRGEALPSIGSVSRMRIASRERGAPPDAPAFAIEVAGGEKGNVAPCALAYGTRVEVRDLFFNTPVRAKFLKSEAAEAAAIAETVTRLALSRPDIAFSLSRDGRELLRTLGNASLEDAIAACFGDSTLSGLLPVRIEGPAGAAIEGFISKPSFHKPNRGWIYFFVNGRAVRDRLMASALEEAYRGLLPLRRHPAAFLRLDIEPSEVDVNVHPAKTEVRFRNPGMIFATIQSAVRNAMAPPRPLPISDAKGLASSKKDAESKQAEGGLFDAGSRPEAMGGSRVADASRSCDRPPRFSAARTFDLWAGERVVGPPRALVSEAPPKYRAEGSGPPAEMAPAGIRESSRPASEPPTAGDPGAADIPAGRPAAAEDFRIVGQAGGAYIVFEDAEGLRIADQHAIHERVLFERFRRKAAGGKWDIQGLLIPITAEVSPEAAAILPEAADLLGTLGFDVEPFGPRSLLIRGVPAAAGMAECAGSLLVEAIEKFASGLRTDRAALGEKVLAMMACKAATKAGERLTDEQMRALVADYRATVSSRGFTCPHGRSVAVEISWEELERKVGR